MLVLIIVLVNGTSKKGKAFPFFQYYFVSVESIKVQSNIAPFANVAILQKSLKSKASSIGVGVHSGVRAMLTICPAPQDTGVVFIRTDAPAAQSHIKAIAANVTDTQLGTTITNAHGVSVSTVEHVLAALYGMGIDNAYIEIDGPEVPILDGSSSPFIDMIRAVGVRTLAAPRRTIEILEVIEVRAGQKFARLEPYNGFELDVEIHFASKAIGHQHGVYDCSEDGFVTELSEARTFGFMHQVEMLRKNGLSRGGSLDNAIVVDGDEVMNQDGLRFSDEFVRHKALDAVGDLSLCGAPLLARYVGHQPGHALNVALVRQLLANPQSWRINSVALDTQILAAAGI